jgi:hypothetical protein
LFDLTEAHGDAAHIRLLIWQDERDAAPGPAGATCAADTVDRS